MSFNDVMPQYMYCISFQTSGAELQLYALVGRTLSIGMSQRSADLDGLTHASAAAAGGHSARDPHCTVVHCDRELYPRNHFVFLLVYLFVIDETVTI